jgi:hypothetical protein
LSEPAELPTLFEAAAAPDALHVWVAHRVLEAIGADRAPRADLTRRPERLAAAREEIDFWVFATEGVEHPRRSESEHGHGVRAVGSFAQQELERVDSATVVPVWWSRCAPGSYGDELERDEVAAIADTRA